MINTTINPAIANNDSVKTIIDACNAAKDKVSIEDLVVHGEAFPHSITTYLQDKHGMDKYDVINLAVNFFEEILWVIEERVEQVLGYSYSTAHEFTDWLTGAQGDYLQDESIKHSALIGAFTGNTDAIDAAFLFYYSAKKAA
jgi:hypothetical protein